MNYTTLLLEHGGPAAKITFNRPDKRNAISAKMICDLLTALDELEKDRTRVVILTGAGSAFCAGWIWKCSRRLASNRRRKIRKTPAAWRACFVASGVFQSR